MNAAASDIHNEKEGRPMAKIIRREWTNDGPTGRLVRHVASGYTLTVNGRRERRASRGALKQTGAGGLGERRA